MAQTNFRVWAVSGLFLAGCGRENGWRPTEEAKKERLLQARFAGARLLLVAPSFKQTFQLGQDE